MNANTYPHIRLEKFLKVSARVSNKTYQLKQCTKVATIPVSSQNEAEAIPASFSFIVENKDSFSSLEIRRKMIAPRLMILRMKLVEVSPQSNGRGLSRRGFTAGRDFERLK